MADIVITCNAIHALEIIAVLVKGNIPFSAVIPPDPLPYVPVPTPAIDNKTNGGKEAAPKEHVLRRGPDKGVKAGGLRAVLLAGLDEPSFTVSDVRDKCRELGLKPTSAGPTLTYYRRDARFLTQNPDRSYSLTELGREEAGKITAGGSLMQTRDEHVAWCKQRAREYLDRGDIKNAITSMLSDMGKREDTKVNSTLALLGMKAIIDHDHAGAKRFVEGFN